jgi:hypothetical protein
MRRDAKRGCSIKVCTGRELKATNLGWAYLLFSSSSSSTYVTEHDGVNGGGTRGTRTYQQHSYPPRWHTHTSAAQLPTLK